MEVHHHPKVEKKNFKEYFLEFLMIFLAVTLGFFAENLREHFVEQKNSQGYLEAFQQELLHNKRIVHDYDSLYTKAISANDSISLIFFEKRENQSLSTIGKLYLSARRTITAPIDVAAYQQLVNSGGLKYIHSIELKDSMAHYAGLIQRFEAYNSIVNANRSALYPAITSIDDYHDLNIDGRIPQVSLFPALDEKERRTQYNYYKIVSIQFSSDKKILKQLNSSNEFLLAMVKNELNK
jgi:hypothetical protein